MGSDYSYETWESWLSEDNRVQNCAIHIIMPKDERDEEMYTEYTMIVGARVYRSVDDTEPVNFEAQRFKFELKEPNYSITDPSIYENFEMGDDFGGIEKEIEILGGESNEMDGTALGDDFADSQVKQDLYTAFESNSIITEPDTLGLFFDLDLPSDFVTDGKIITQLAELTNSDGQTLTMECTVQVGNPDFTRVSEWVGTVDTTETGVTFEDQSFGTKYEDSSISKIDDFDFYALSDSEFDSFNKIQSCVADFQIEKDDVDVWGLYQVTVHARIFDNREATEFIALDTTSFEIDLVKPTFEEIDYTDEDFNWDDEDSVEKIWENVAYVMGEGSVVETDASNV